MPHNFQMPQNYVDRMVERLGREHVQETFETDKTALIVVDMQNDFCAEGGYINEVKHKDVSHAGELRQFP